MTDDARHRLIVALDKDEEGNSRLVDTLGDSVTFYKVGAVSLFSGGERLLRRLLDAGKSVFLDLKIFDVPNTVGQSVARVAQLGVTFTTVHGNRPTVEAAVKGRGSSDLKILAVTALTSLSAGDVREMYDLPHEISLSDHVVNTTRRMVEAGCDGVIASSHEVSAIRAAVPADVLIVTPGIRLADDAPDDQKRIATPYDSIRSGADYLVVGRSIYQHEDPVARVERYVDEIARGFSAR